MNAPPQAENPLTVDSSTRNFTGWICFGVLLAFILVALTMQPPKKQPRLQGHDSDQLALKEVLSAESLIGAVANGSPKTVASNRDALSKSLDGPISGLVLDADKDPFAAMLYAEMRTYQKQTVPPRHIQILAKSRFPEDQAFYKIYSASSLTPTEAERLIALLPSEPFVYKAARVQALEKAGIKDAVSRYVSPVSSIGIAVAAFASWPFLAASVAIWMIFWRRIREGKLEPKGIPLEAITDHDADRLAIRAAQIFAIFIFSQYAVYIALPRSLHLTETDLGVLCGIITLLGIYALQRVPVDGKKIQLSVMGFTAANLKSDLLLGVMGFVAEFPVSLVLAEVCASLLRFLPKATHPASEALEHSRDLRTVIPVLIAGCVIAPIWEELMFRGLLFPGLKRLMRGLVPAIALSSLMFACVHPQGVTVWIPLAFVGATSCYLSYQSRSLVPGMVMHCLHNTAIFAMFLLS